MAINGGFAEGGFVGLIAAPIVLVGAAAYKKRNPKMAVEVDDEF